MAMANRDFSIVRAETVYRVSQLIDNTSVLFTRPPCIGLVVGTFASVPYIHLHLEARRRFYPELPLLVHDDASPKVNELKRLCDDYGCEFETNDIRQPPFIGDLSCFIGGLLWGRQRGIDLLVKMSRRFVPVENWIPGLQALAMASQYPTYCSHTVTFGFGFRSECVGIAVREWIALRMHHALVSTAIADGTPFVEGFIHNLARRLADLRCSRARDWDERQGHRPGDRDGYAPWDFMGTDRCTKYPSHLWHDSAAPGDYARCAQQWGLPYVEQDFVDPNQGFGNGT
jgi:hypothetical protein